MPTQTRTHVVMPRELIDAVDRLVGPRRRSQFLAEAAEEQLARVSRGRLAQEFAGSMANTDVPGWESSEAAAEWVRALRGGCACHDESTTCRHSE